MGGRIEVLVTGWRSPHKSFFTVKFEISKLFTSCASIYHVVVNWWRMMTFNCNADQETSLVASSPFPKASGAQSSFSYGYKCSNSKYVQRRFNNYIKENRQNWISVLVTCWQSGCSLSILQNSLYFRKKNNRKCWKLRAQCPLVALHSIHLGFMKFSIQFKTL